MNSKNTTVLLSEWFSFGFLLVRNFLEWMYPVGGGEESVEDAALGVVILWFCW